MGRKKLTLDNLPENWKDIIFEKFEVGHGKAEVLKELGISRTGHRTLMNYPEFSDAWNWGELIYEAWWYEQGRKNLENKSFNNTLWIFNMKNRFKWRDAPVGTAPEEKDATTTPKEEKEILEEYRVN